MKKEKAVITRVGENLFNEIERFSKELGWSKSVLFRAALIEYLFIYGTPESYTIANTAEYSYMINLMTESQINELAEITCQSAKNFNNYFQKNFLNLDIDSFSINRVLDFLLKYMFSAEGQKYFKRIKKIKNKNQITIFGEHAHSKKFSLYMKLFLLKYLEDYQIEVTKEEIADNKFMLEFNYK